MRWGKVVRALGRWWGRLAGLMRRLRAARARLTPRARIGRAGEAAAAALLKRAGLRVVQRNWRCGRYELDIICRHGPQLVFVEVRTRSANAAVDGLASTRGRKRQRLRRAIAAYLRQRHRREVPPWRLDVVAVCRGADGHLEPVHYPNCSLERDGLINGR